MSDHYLIGLERQAQGDLEAAEAYFKAVPPDSPDYRDARLRLGRLALDTGRPALAEQAAEQALEDTPDAAGWTLLGEALLAQDRAREAQGAFARAARLDAGSPEPCILAGHAHVAAGQLPEAIRAYEEALKRDNKHLAARYYMAEALVRAGEIMRASTQLHYVQILTPDYVPAIMLRGDIAFHQGDYRQAIVEYCRAIDREAVGADVYARLGEAFVAIEDADQAVKAYEQALRLDPEAWACHAAAARLQESRGRLAEARRHYAAVAYVSAYRDAAAAGLARLDARLAEAGEAEPAAEPAAPASAFEAPEVLRRVAPAKASGTRPIGARIPPRAAPARAKPGAPLPPLPQRRGDRPPPGD